MFELSSKFFMMLRIANVDEMIVNDTPYVFEGGCWVMRQYEVAGTFQHPPSTLVFCPASRADF